MCNEEWKKCPCSGQNVDKFPTTCSWCTFCCFGPLLLRLSESATVWPPQGITCFSSISFGPLLHPMTINLKSNDFVVPTRVAITLRSSPVEEASSPGCGAEPVATGQTPQTNTKLNMAPYEQVNVTATFTSELERYHPGGGGFILFFYSKNINRTYILQLPIQTR